MSHKITSALAALLLTTTVFAQAAQAQVPRGTTDVVGPRDVANENAKQTEDPQPSPDMMAVLKKLTDLGAKPIGTLTVEQTRSQPSPADAAMAVMKDRHLQADPRFTAIKTKDMTIEGPGGEIAIRIYTPEGEGPFPLILYYHGGGWVIADLDTYDMSTRVLAAKTGAVVVSAHYRQAPENHFPAAHEDAWAAYQWATHQGKSLNVDLKKIAVAAKCRRQSGSQCCH